VPKKVVQKGLAQGVAVATHVCWMPPTLVGSGLKILMATV
jgi:hypothetical protein